MKDVKLLLLSEQHMGCVEFLYRQGFDLKQMGVFT